MLLQVPPFRIERHGLVYASDAELQIDLSIVSDGIYRVLAVHNFHVEDRNRNLDECVGGIFLAGLRRDGTWEEPERFPVECRALGILATVEVRGGTARLLAGGRP
jgi:hypothetical protein